MTPGRLSEWTPDMWWMLLIALTIIVAAVVVARRQGPQMSGTPSTSSVHGVRAHDRRGDVAPQRQREHGRQRPLAKGDPVDRTSKPLRP